MSPWLAGLLVGCTAWGPSGAPPAERAAPTPGALAPDLDGRPTPTPPAAEAAPAPPAPTAWLRDPPEGFVDLRALEGRGLRFDIRYHTADNFTGDPLPGYGAPGAWLREAPAAALVAAHEALAEDGYGLLVKDAYRPLRGTLAMVAWAERAGRVDLLDDGYVARRSNHNRGTTVDVTLYALATGDEVDMGTPWDTLDARAHTRHAEGEVLARRLRLAGALRAEGFRPYSKEWWHFTHGTDPRPPLRDVPYGCFEVDEGTWEAPSGWEEPGWRPQPAPRPERPCGRGGADAAPISSSPTVP